MELQQTLICAATKRCFIYLYLRTKTPEPGLEDSPKFVSYTLSFLLKLILLLYCIPFNVSGNPCVVFLTNIFYFLMCSGSSGIAAFSSCPLPSL